jgi:hypothetical protein
VVTALVRPRKPDQVRLIGRVPRAFRARFQDEAKRLGMTIGELIEKLFRDAQKEADPSP